MNQIPPQQVIPPVVSPLRRNELAAPHKRWNDFTALSDRFRPRSLHRRAELGCLRLSWIAVRGVCAGSGAGIAGL